jgi:RNA polymerase sigma-70 factor, ECF subfamily
MLRDRHKSDDLVHDCLVRALGRLHTLHEKVDIRPWLFSIVHELLISRTWTLKSRAGSQTHCGEASGDLKVSAGQDNGMGGRDLMRIVEDLPDEQRRVLLLVTVEDLSYADTARVLRVPIDTVVSQLSLAREKLHQSLSSVTAPTLRRVK